MKKVSRSEDSTDVNVKELMTKESINLNVVHDVAQMAPHALNALKDVGHAVGQDVGHAIDWAKDTITRPIHDVQNYGKDVQNFAESLDNGQHSLGPTIPELGQARGHVDAMDAGHAINAIGVGSAIPAGIAKGVGMGINRAIDTFGDRRQQRSRDKFLRRHPMVDKFSSTTFNSKFATDDEKGHYKYIHKDGNEWVVVQKGTGKVLSRHKTENEAISSFKAMMVNKHGSVVTAGAWPSEADWEGHLRNLEELLSETQKGVGWHAAKGEAKEMKAHNKLAIDLQKSIDDLKKVMKFRPAKTASAEDEW